MLLPVTWWVCVSLLVPARVPAPAAKPAPAPASKATGLPLHAARLAAKLDRYIAGAAGTLDSRPRGMLDRIPDRRRRMLAVVHYLRLRDEVDSLWAWSEAERLAYQRTVRYQRTMADIQQVRRTFARLNPGYSLAADTAGRPLRTQLRFWNRERSVADAARELQDSLAAWLTDGTFPDSPDGAALGRFIERAAAYRAARLPTVAVPGLSLHGRLRAFDFAVLRRGRVVAGTTSATIDSVWDGRGWSERLREAVAGAGSDLAGPMETPREPWHYEYRPEMP